MGTPSSKVGWPLPGTRLCFLKQATARGIQQEKAIRDLQELIANLKRRYMGFGVLEILS